MIANAHTEASASVAGGAAQSRWTQPPWRLGPITCAFADPARRRAFWAFESYKILRGYAAGIAEIAQVLRAGEHAALTRERLERSLVAARAHLVQLEAIMRPLGHAAVQPEDFLRYLQMAPGQSPLTTSFDTLFRDWVWGEEETACALDLIRRVSAPGHPYDRCLVLGSGASRLAYELHRTFAPFRTVALDINPLLLLVAARIIRGETIELYEFPVIPRDLGCYEVLRELRAPEPLGKDFELVLSDARAPCFPPKSFETVVTPWFIDAVDAELPDLLAVINRQLVVGGTWVNYGPLHFNLFGVARFHSADEVFHFVERAGFELRDHVFEVVPHMCCPESTAQRTERVLAFTARKVRDLGQEA